MNANVGLCAGVMGFAGLCTYLYAVRAARRYRVEHLRIVLGGNGDGALENAGKDFAVRRRLSILHLSDTHLCRGDEDKAAFLQQVTSHQYDMVVITGDIFENESGLQYASSLLAKAPRLGAYAVLGNHDYYAYNLFHKTVGQVIRRFERPSNRRDVSSFITALETSGYTVLRNQLVSMPEENIALIGIDYPGINEDELNTLVDKVKAQELLLAIFHLPKNLGLLSQGKIKLALGGHTHGGQVRVPGYGAILTRSEMSRHEACGLIWRDNTAFHISRGIGTDPRTNFRLFCPPAATILDVIV